MFTLVVEYGDSTFDWVTEGTLFKFQTTASKILTALKTGQNLLQL